MITHIQNGPRLLAKVLLQYLESEKGKPWAGAIENYRLEEENGKNQLTVNMDLEDEYKDYFFETWPKALEKLKELAENGNEFQ